jgi:hypothetical protein
LPFKDKKLSHPKITGFIRQLQQLRKGKKMFQRFLKIKYFISAIFLLFILIGCGIDENIIKSEVKTLPGTYTSKEEVIAIIQAYGKTISHETQPLSILMAPSSGEWEVTEVVKVKKESQVIVLEVPGVREVEFEVRQGSLKKKTEISMKLFLEIVQNTEGIDELGTLYFQFSPSGTQFDPSALLEIPFELLLTDEVDTFVITDENGNEIDGVSYDIDYKNEKLVTYIPHFSYYYYERR